MATRQGGDAVLRAEMPCSQRVRATRPRRVGDGVQRGWVDMVDGRCAVEMRGELLDAVMAVDWEVFFVETTLG